MKLEDAQNKHKEMYEWISQKTQETKHYVARDCFLKQSKENKNIFNFDFCCEYAYRIIAFLGLENKKATTKEYNSGTFGEAFCRKFCPCTWGSAGTCYENKLVKEYDSLRVTEWERLSELSQEISELPFKGAFEISCEDAKLLREAGFGEVYSFEERRDNNKSNS